VSVLELRLVLHSILLGSALLGSKSCAGFPVSNNLFSTSKAGQTPKRGRCIELPSTFDQMILIAVSHRSKGALHKKIERLNIKPITPAPYNGFLPIFILSLNSPVSKDKMRVTPQSMIEVFFPS
jgi:hypothetical protein